MVVDHHKLPLIEHDYVKDRIRERVQSALWGCHKIRAGHLVYSTFVAGTEK